MHTQTHRYYIYIYVCVCVSRYVCMQFCFVSDLSWLVVCVFSILAQFSCWPAPPAPASPYDARPWLITLPWRRKMGTPEFLCRMLHHGFNAFETKEPMRQNLEWFSPKILHESVSRMIRNRVISSMTPAGAMIAMLPRYFLEWNRLLDQTKVRHGSF